MKLDIVVLWITFTIDRLNEMRKFLGVIFLSCFFFLNANSETIFYGCIGKTQAEKVKHGLNFDKMIMTHWNDQKVNYPITKIEGSYVWVEERDDVGGMFPNSRIINYFDKSKNTLNKFFYGISYEERDLLRSKIESGKDKYWSEDGPKFIEYQVKILQENFKSQFEFKLTCKK